MTTLVLYCSCATSVISNTEVGATDEPIYASDFWNTVQVLPLVENSTEVLGSVSKVRYNDSLYFLLNDRQNLLEIFNKEGVYTNVLNRQGNAKNEYITVSDFDVSNDSIYMLCFPNKLLIADLSCNIQKAVKLKDNFTRIAWYKGSLYLYEQQERGVYILKNGKFEKIHSDGEMPGCLHHNNEVFFKVGNKLLFYPEGGDTMYSIEGNLVQDLFCLDYPNKNRIFKIMSSKNGYDNLEVKEKINLSPPNLHSIIDTPDYWIVSYTFEGIVRACSINKESLSVSKDGYWCFSSYPMLSTSDGAITCQFVTDKKLPVDTNKMKINIKYISRPIQKDGQLCLINYKNE